MAKGKLIRQGRGRTASAKAVMNLLQDKGSKARVPLRTGRRPGTATGYERAFLQKPEWSPGTLPEWAIYWAHLQLGMKVEEDFVYISHIAGIQMDFEELGQNLALNIQGNFWHYEFQSSSKIAEDIITRSIVESTGTILIDIDEDNALQDPIYFLKEALAGRDHSLQAKGNV